MTDRANAVRFEDIVAGLRKLPVLPDPIVLTHLSLKSFGYVDGGAITVIRALQEWCGEGGTLVMPTLTIGSIDESHPVYDAAHTPSRTGHVTEVFRKLPHAKRSLHLFSSCAAMGRDAEELVRFHDDTPCGPDSPYWKIAHRNGYSLFIGAGFESNTLFHVAEEMTNPDYLVYKTIPNARVIDDSGAERIRTFRRYDCTQRGIIRRWARLEPLYRESGAIHEVTIGEAKVMLLKASDNIRISCDVLRKDPSFVLE